MSQDSKQIARVLQVLAKNLRGRVSVGWMIALVVLVGGYLVAEPALEARWGIDLPGLHSPGVAVAETGADRDAPNHNSRKQPTSKADTRGEKPAVDDAPPTSTHTPIEQPARTTPAKSPSTREQKPPSTNVGVTADETLETYLKRTGPSTFLSPAGLIYTSGSQHGHRLKHLMAHAEDDPDRRGSHGVFVTSDPLEVVMLVDEAYRQALDGNNTVTSDEGSRTVYTVNLRRKVGTIGGQSGKRRGHPTARHIRLVVEGKKLITAFPLIP